MHTAPPLLDWLGEVIGRDEHSAKKWVIDPSNIEDKSSNKREGLLKVLT